MTSDSKLGAVSRRTALRTLGSLGAASLVVGCAGPGEKTGDRQVAPVSNPPGETINAETTGPYPANGTNGPNVLDDPKIVRRDIRSTYDIGAGTAQGIHLRLEFTVLGVSQGAGEPLPGAAVYAWHCDREGRYSLYSDGIEQENFLRGLQEADADGLVTFDTVFPGCYPGRWPHVHLKIYASLDDAAAGRAAMRTTQMAFPKKPCVQVYKGAEYAASKPAFEQVSLDEDAVFADGYALQLATMSGDPSAGYVARLRLPV